MSETPRLEPCRDGRSRLWVRAQPGARRSGIAGLWNGALKVAVRAPAQDGRANEELLAVLAAALDLRPRDLELDSGSTARDKQVLVPLALPRLRELLLAALPQD